MLGVAGLTISPGQMVQGKAERTAGRVPPKGSNDRTLFAFDDHSIPFRDNLKLTLVEAAKYPGNPVLRRGPKGSPDEGHAILYGTVIKEGDKFRMWYLGMFETNLDDDGQPPGYWRPMCYAESTDGINWVKPDLGLVEFNGNKHNNICLITGTPESWTEVDDFLSVLYEPEVSNPMERYKLVFINHIPYDDIYKKRPEGDRRDRVVGAIAATSFDGLSWVINKEPVQLHTKTGSFEVSGLYRFGDFYYATGQAFIDVGGKGSRMMAAYRSPDFRTWTEAKAASFIRCGQLTHPPHKEQEAHIGAGIWNRNNILIGLYGMWEDSGQPPELRKGAAELYGVHTDLGLIISNDGIHYREPVTDFKVVSRGKPGEWDDVALLQGNAFVNEGDRTMIWYSHWDTRGTTMKSMEIGLALLRRDGFGFLSRQVDKYEAHFITAASEVGKKATLKINVDNISDEAPLSIELLDHLDRPLPGYSGAEAALVKSNGIQVTVAWPHAAYLPSNKKLAVRVNFPLKSEARVYALYLETKA